ncbi:hypothetical protein [Streptomyces sp. NPDC101145]|uniref:hypothetical protein n=1 Tax=Streptomyces sp. NPDC101145 TaxID=3366112 RepID=UPI003806E4E4
MSLRGERWRQALGSLGQLQWFKLSAGRHPVYDYEHVPYVAWRFTEATEYALDAIFSAMNGATITTEWILDTSGKNWILAPARIAEASNGVDSNSFYDAIQEAIDHDQDFCRTATGDLDEILTTLEEGIRLGTGE